MAKKNTEGATNLSRQLALHILELKPINISGTSRSWQIANLRCKHERLGIAFCSTRPEIPDRAERTATCGVGLEEMIAQLWVAYR